MAGELRILRDGRRIPVVAFFGTKGGVGKTTIAKFFADLVTGASSSPNVLTIDVDVHNRGMTALLTKHTPTSVKSVHDYIASKNYSDVEAIEMTHMIEGGRPGSGRLFFIPSSTPEADHVFEESARIGPEMLLDILYHVADAAVQTYRCDCVVIDCGPIIDPYTAAGATLADRVFLIGQNEPISFSNLKFYPTRIREFYPQFSVGKMMLIINKVRGWERLEERRLHEDIFYAIPFTMDIVDISEGLAAADEMKILMFKDHIAQIVEKALKADHPELVPERNSVLPQRWESLVEHVDELERAPIIRRLGMLRMAMPIGLLALVIGVFLVYAGSTERHLKEGRARLKELAATLESTAATKKAAGQNVEALERAAGMAKDADPSDSRSIERVIEVAKSAGFTQVPPAQRLDTSKENLGIGIACGAVLVSGIGLSCGHSRRRYLDALQVIRRKGAKGIMEKLTVRSWRRTFDKLLQFTDAL